MLTSAEGQRKADASERRGPSRPRIIRTGKPGRPTKQYRITTTTDVAADVPEQSVDQESSDMDDDQLLDQHDAGLTMNACEISFEQAIFGPDKQEWEDAICSEVRSLILNDTFDFVERPTNGKVIKCRTVLRNKYGAVGQLKRRKARVVTKRFT